MTPPQYSCTCYSANDQPATLCIRRMQKEYRRQSTLAWNFSPYLPLHVCSQHMMCSEFSEFFGKRPDGLKKPGGNSRCHPSPATKTESKGRRESVKHRGSQGNLHALTHLICLVSTFASDQSIRSAGIFSSTSHISKVAPKEQFNSTYKEPILQ